MQCKHLECSEGRETREFVLADSRSEVAFDDHGLTCSENLCQRVKEEAERRSAQGL